MHLLKSYSLKKHGIIISKKEIKNVVLIPEHIDIISDQPNRIASKEFDATHVLRVVYKIEDDIIKVITFYPAEKGRYY